MCAIVAMDTFDVICAVPVVELKVNHLTELNFSGELLGMEGFFVLSASLKGSTSLLSLDISTIGDELMACNLVGRTDYIDSREVKGTAKKGGVVRLATGATAVVAHTYTSGGCIWVSCWDTTAVTALAAAIKDNRSLTKLTFGGDDGGDASRPVTLQKDMTEADFSGSGLTGAAGLLLASFLPRCRYVIIICYHRLNLSDNPRCLCTLSKPQVIDTPGHFGQSY